MRKGSEIRKKSCKSQHEILRALCWKITHRQALSYHSDDYLLWPLLLQNKNKVLEDRLDDKEISKIGLCILFRR